MNVKVISIKKVLKENTRFLGIAQILLNDSLVINDVRIIQGSDSKFIAMPSYKIEDKYCDFAHATNMETATQIKDIVIKTYMDVEEKSVIEGTFEVGKRDKFKVTKLRINHLANETGIVAIVDVVLNECFALHRMAVIKELANDGKYKVKILVPAKDDAEGNKKSIYYITNEEFLEYITKVIIDAYIQDEKKKY